MDPARKLKARPATPGTPPRVHDWAPTGALMPLIPAGHQNPGLTLGKKPVLRHRLTATAIHHSPWRPAPRVIVARNHCTTDQLPGQSKAPLIPERVRDGGEISFKAWGCLLHAALILGHDIGVKLGVNVGAIKGRKVVWICKVADHVNPSH